MSDQPRDRSQSSASESATVQQQSQQSLVNRTTNFFQRRSENATQSVLAVSIIGALVSGYFVQWTITNLLASVVLFVGFAFASWIAIIGRSSALGAISAFFYTVAVAGLLAPVLFFIQLVTQVNNASGFEALGTGIGLAAVFPTVSLLHLHIAIVFAVLGYALKLFTGQRRRVSGQGGDL